AGGAGAYDDDIEIGCKRCGYHCRPKASSASDAPYTGK
ncbi:MAG: hypothetical protein JWM26_4142, partial [Betaproteobacteria bacterium]|nr:hypothetical protein [Betaproteobacteria bacterium]